MFNASDARKLSYEWNLRDEMQMRKIKRKVKRCCKRGKRELVLLMTPSSKVVKQLEHEHYKVTMGDPFGAVLEW